MSLEMVGAPLRRRLSGWSLLLILLISASPTRAADENKLGKLSCVSLVVEALQQPVAGTLHISQEALQRALVVGLGTAIPRLAVREDLDTCLQNLLYVHVSLAMIPASSGRTLGYHGHVSLKLYRDATVVDTARVARVAVWDEGALVVGPPEGAESQVLGALNTLLGAFATAYRAAGNP
jgi:hypothetical protein